MKKWVFQYCGQYTQDNECLFYFESELSSLERRCLVFRLINKACEINMKSEHFESL